MVKDKSARPGPAANKDEVKARTNSAIFLLAALDMSWRLALVVLVPIIGGFELDKHLGSGPVLTIIGFLVSMVGVFLILRQTVANADASFKPKEPGR